MTTVAVTGATGFLGRALVRHLRDRGDTVVAIARAGTDPERLAALGDMRVVSDGDVAALHAEGPDAFAHLAWGGVVAAGREDDDLQRTNVAATEASVRFAASAGCRYWLGTGSQAEYGDQIAPREDTDLTPRTAYGRAKVAAYAAARALGDELGVTVGWARVYSVYGPGDRPDAVLPYAISELLAGRAPELGPCTHDWDLLHVDDAAAALAALLDAQLEGPTNVASGDARPLRETIELAADAAGTDARPRFDDARSPSPPLRADVARLLGTGWRPGIPLESGIEQLVASIKGASTLLSEP